MYTFTARVEITDDPENPGHHRAALVRVISDEEGEKIRPLLNLTGLTVADVNFKFGIQLPATPLSEEDGYSEAEKILREGLANVSQRAMVTSTEVENILLDALNILHRTEKDDNIE